jgi:hypothetical protein
MNNKQLLKLIKDKRKDCWNRYDIDHEPKYVIKLKQRLKDKKMFEEIKLIEDYGYRQYRRGRIFAYKFLVQLEKKIARCKLR